jgi:hypothetical protein
LGIQDISPDFVTKAGYITRTGILLARAAVSPKFYPDSETLQRCEFTASISYIKDKFYDLDETENTVSLKFSLPKNSSITAQAGYSTEVYGGQTFRTSGFQLDGKSQLTKQFYINISCRYGNAIYYSEEPYQGRGARASGTIILQPSNKLKAEMMLTYSDFYRDADSEKIYDYSILRGKLTYQMNRYLFFRGIVEYNNYDEELLADFLASFTYIPGTVIHLGYGSFHEKIRWHNNQYMDSDRFLETQRGFFFKTSYLWRL